MADADVTDERIRKLEAMVEVLGAELRTQRDLVGIAAARVALADVVADEVVMPALLLLAGQGYRLDLLRLLEGAKREIERMDGVRETARDHELARIDGWLRAVDAIPRWRPLDYAERNRED